MNKKAIDTKEQNVLIVFHLNFLKKDRGCSNYVYMIARKLKDMGYHIDFFATNIQTNLPKDVKLFNEKEKLIDNFYYVETNGNFMSNSWCNEEVCSKFNDVINSKHYDFINIHYIQWADLVKYAHIPMETEIIYSMQDSSFMQYYYSNRENIGNIFVDEVQKLFLFDKIACISYDEMLFWKHLVPQKDFYFLPQGMKQKEIKSAQEKYDVLFIGANNQYNIEGILWFLDEVYPKIEKDISIAICGNVVKAIKDNHRFVYDKMVKNNFTLIEFSDNLDELYSNVKVCIVPMLRGTGMKIKTIEAMSYGKPIVTTLLGIDGFPDKTKNGILVSDEADTFAVYIKNLLENKEFYKEVVNKQNEYFNEFFSEKVVEQKILSTFTKSTDRQIRNKNKTFSLEENSNTYSNNILKIKLFNFIPLFKYKQIGGRKVYKILGLPIFKMRKMANGITTKYYFLGIPVLKVSKRN